jgi:hypothetical protein
MGRRIMRNILTGTDEALISIRDKLFGGLTSKASELAK